LYTSHFTFQEIYKNPPSYLAVKLNCRPLFPKLIEDYQVPMFKHDFMALNQLPWDISFPHLILHIDGITHVKRIAEQAEMDLEFVKRSLTLLEYYGVIVVTDIFRFTNIYRLQTEYGLPALINPTLINEIIEFSLMRDPEVKNNNNNNNNSTSNNNNNNNSKSSANIPIPPTSTSTASSTLLSPIPTTTTTTNNSTTNNTTNNTTNSTRNAHNTTPPPPPSNDNNNNNNNSNNNNTTSNNMEHYQRVKNMISFLSKLQPGQTIGQILYDFIHDNNNKDHLQRNIFKGIDINRLLAAAQLSGLIIRHYEYPVYIESIDSKTMSSMDHFHKFPYEPEKPNSHSNTSSSSSIVSTEESNNSSNYHSHNNVTSTPIPIIPNNNNNNNNNNTTTMNTPGIRIPNNAIKQHQHQSSYFSTLTKEDNNNNNSNNNSRYSDLLVTAQPRVELTEPLHTGESTRVFTKGLTRNKSLVGRSSNESSQRQQRQHKPQPTVDQFVHLMDGNECLDAVCCKYQLGYLDVMHHPNIQIIYK
jgi:hypothetical protein